MKHRIMMVLLLVGLASGAAAQRPATRFEAVAEVSGKQGTRSMPVSFSVDRAMTFEDAVRYREVLKSGGQTALLDVIRQHVCGRILLGAQELPLNLIFAEKTSDGWKYVVVTARNFHIDEVQLQTESLDYPFGVAVFTVPDGRRGEGQLLTRATLAIGADGRATAAGYEGQTGRLKDIKEREVRR